MPRRKVNKVSIGVEFRAIPSKGGNLSFDELLVDKLGELKRTQGEDFIADKIKSLIRAAYASGWPDNEALPTPSIDGERSSVEADTEGTLDDAQISTIPSFLMPAFD